MKPLVPIGANGRTPRAVLVAVIGLPDEQLDAAIDAALADGHPDGVFPVFLTDSCAFGKFVRRRVLFEHHPPRDCRSRTIGSLDWDLYERRRLQLLLTKWRPLRVIAFGAEARARLDEWHREPEVSVRIPRRGYPITASGRLALLRSLVLPVRTRSWDK